jgi:hypothetical protein
LERPVRNPNKAGAPAAAGGNYSLLNQEQEDLSKFQQRLCLRAQKEKDMKKGFKVERKK